MTGQDAARGIAGGVALRHDPAGPSWSLAWSGIRFDVHVHGAALVCDYFGADEPAPPPPLWAGWREYEQILNARMSALVEIGARRTCVAWRLHDWHRPDADSLAIVLVAEAPPLECTVCFSVDRASGMLLRSTRLRHFGAPEGAAIPVTGALSFWLTLRGTVERAAYLTGAWGAEAQATNEDGGRATLLLDSRTGKTGFAFQPWLALQGAGATTVFQLLWSGNWSIEARMRPATTTVAGGLHDWGLAHDLAPGAVLDLPEAVMGHVAGGIDAATRRLHDWRRARRPDPRRPIPVQFNTWYACDEDVDAARMLALVPLAAALGCEMFVLDAGWYTTFDHDPAADWFTRTGDWLVDPRRFPAGLGPLREACSAAGMGFGIWCEPEAVGPRARLRAAHPEWLHHIDDRPPAADARALLNLGVPAAWEHAFALLAGLVRETGAGWLKWDFNANLAAGGWAPGLPAALTRQDPLVAHIQGLYRLQDALRAEFPALVLEMCASGGGRMDGAILARAHTNWISDQPQAVAKLAIHFGMQQAHPAVCCNDWLVDWPARTYPGVAGVDGRGDLLFRLRVAMLGSFGISAPIDAWPAEERAVVAAQVALYRSRLRALVQDGDQYQLTAAPGLDGSGEWAAMWFVAKDGVAGALFAFRLGGEASREFALPGLARAPRRIEGAGGVLEAGGVRVTLDCPYRSALLLVG